VEPSPALSPPRPRLLFLSVWRVCCSAHVFFFSGRFQPSPVRGGSSPLVWPPSSGYTLPPFPGLASLFPPLKRYIPPLFGSLRLDYPPPRRPVLSRLDSPISREPPFQECAVSLVNYSAPFMLGTWTSPFPAWSPPQGSQFSALITVVDFLPSGFFASALCFFLCVSSFQRASWPPWLFFQTGVSCFPDPAPSSFPYDEGACGGSVALFPHVFFFFFLAFAWVPGVLAYAFPGGRLWV